MRILILANTYQCISGSDVIFAETSKRWFRWGHKTTIITNEKGTDFCLSRGISQKNVITWSGSFSDSYGIYLSSLAKTISSIFRSLNQKVSNFDMVYSSSIFWPDVLPGLILKLRNPRVQLAVGIYIVFPNPFKNEKYHGGYLKSLALYICQVISFIVVRKAFDYVITSSESCKKGLNEKFKQPKLRILAIRGGVDLKEINRVIVRNKAFDVLYLGRFHSQKGLLDLLDIWQYVVRNLPDKRLLLAGGGPLENTLRSEVKSRKVASSVYFTGEVDGKEKYTLIKSSRLFVSASKYNTGDIALDEALACGVPGLIYDLPDLDYGGGVVKIPIGEKRTMAKAVIELLQDSNRRNKLGKTGQLFIKKYDWNTRAKILLEWLQGG